ncbi:MAG: hypothetical protein AABZ30_09545 [Myxococcota bacterium]
MNCRDAIEGVSRGAVKAPRSEVEGHLRGCASCRDELRARLGALGAGVLADAPPEAGDRRWDEFWRRAERGLAELPSIGLAVVPRNGHAQSPAKHAAPLDAAVATLLFPDEQAAITREGKRASTSRAALAAVVGVVALGIGIGIGSLRTSGAVASLPEPPVGAPAKASRARAEPAMTSPIAAPTLLPASAPAPDESPASAVPPTKESQPLARPDGDADSASTAALATADVERRPARSEENVAKAAPVAPAGEQPKDELEALLAGALTTDAREPPKKDQPKKETMDLDVGGATGLGPSQIRDGMSKLQQRVDSCAAKNEVTGGGMVYVQFVIAPSGRVTTARATKKYAGTPVGDCVAEAVKGATFPSFVGDPQSVVYPLPLR